jgi:lysozyme
MAVVGANCVIDLYHLDSVTDWGRVKAAGIVGVLHKATEGVTVTDSKYHSRRDAARAAGLLWGCYHFSSGNDGTAQANHLLDYAAPDDGDIVCVDVEPSHSGPNMTYAQLLSFVTRISARLGRLPMIYGGQSLLVDLMRRQASSIVTQCPLWYVEYPAEDATHPKHPLPHGWADWTLWQYTGDGVGPLPHGVDGIDKCDRDTFNGTVSELKQQWPFVRRAQ